MSQTTIPRTSRAGFWLFATALAAAYVWALRWTWIDDAMITLTYARSLAEGAGFSLAPGTTHYGFTSPLNVLLLAAVGLLVGFDRAIAVTTVGLILLLLVASRRLSRSLFDDPTAGTALTVALSLSPWIASTFGLETFLGTVLSVFLLDAWFGARARTTGILLALLMLTRPDYGTVAILAVLLVPRTTAPFAPRLELQLTRSRFRHCLRVLAWAAPPLVLWHGFAWVALGSALPVTLLIKIAQSGWGSYHFASGPWMYVTVYPVAAAGSLLPLAALWWLARGHHGRSPSWGLASASLLFGLAHFAGLALLRVPPYHWYYVPSLSFLLIAAWIGACGRRRDPTARRRLAAAFALVAALPFGLSLLRHDLPFDEAPIHSNWASHRDYRDMAYWLAENLPADDVIGLRGEIGTLAYYSRLRLADHFSHPGAFADLNHKAGFGEPTRFGAVKAINFHFHPGAAPLAPEWCVHGRERPRPGDGTVQSWTFSTSWSIETPWVVRPCAVSQRGDFRENAPGPR